VAHGEDGAPGNGQGGIFVETDRFAKLKDILLQAADLSEAEQRAFLDEACEDDPELRREVEELLARDGQSTRLPKLDEMIGPVKAGSSDPGRMIGKTFGHYEVVELLGRGGMGEVYRGRDTKLRREVALKTLPDPFASDPERIARLQREARTLASFQHLNVASIFGLEEAEGQEFVVMELVEGEDLARRLGRGPLPVEEALEIAFQIAEGLEAAHEKGIVHRDLKPANVKVTPEGKVKILDFGLARACHSESTDPDMAHSPTISEVMTQKGVLLGTAAYMSPEQARGKRVDHRTDIWAFGCLLYELLTGRMAFPGETVSDTLASILQREPDWAKLPNRVPPGIRRLLKRCLVKDIRNRLQAIGEARIAIEESPSEPTADIEKMATTGSTWKRLILWAPLLPLVAVLVWILKPTETPVSVPTVRFEIPLPEGQRLASYYRHAVAITPDGRTLAFVSGTTSHVWAYPDTTQIYLRPLSERQARPVPGTENGFQPIFSPNGEWLGFVRGGQLMKVPVGGGEPVALCECGRAFGASWGSDGTIVFASKLGGLRRVSASGGKPDTLTHLDSGSGEVSHRLPHVLPDGKAVLFTALPSLSRGWNEARIYAQSLVTGERTLLVEGGSDARYLPTGYLVFAREGKLMAVHFDPDQLVVTGPETPVLNRVNHSIHTEAPGRETGAAHFAISATGVLAYVEGSVFPEIKHSVVWVDREGREDALGVEPMSYVSVRVSPSGDAVLLGERYPPADAWLWDLGRQVQSRQTFKGNIGWAIWGPELNVFTVDSDREGPRLLYRKAVDSGPGSIEKLPAAAEDIWASSWSPNGKELAAVGPGENDHDDIFILSSEGQMEPLVQTRYTEKHPEFSPDGRWLAYTSNESGQEEVYVRPFPGRGRTVQISVGGGSSPAWSSDGREMFYRKYSEYGRMRHDYYSVQLDVGDDRLVPGQPEKLFGGTYVWTDPIRSYDVAADGRLLLIKLPDESSMAAAIEEVFPTRIQVVQDWFAELREKMPEGR
jgi:serine/threonine protein kinase/Tol biopolymer transport system component